MQRRAHKAVAAAAVVFLVVNALLLLPDGHLSPSSIEYDASEYSRRLGSVRAHSPRERVINELFKQGIRPGNPNYRRLLNARLERLQKRNKKAVSQRQTMRTLRNTKNIWYRRSKAQQAELEEKVSGKVNVILLTGNFTKML